MPLQLGRDEARQLAVRAQLLDATRPTDLVDLVEQLTLLQIDPTAAIAPNADLVAWSRLGASYQPADLTRALEDRTLFELRAFVRPMNAVAVHVPEDTAYTAQSSVRRWLNANDGFQRDVLARLHDVGPLLSRDVPDTCQVPWGSTGWTNNRNVTQMLELLSARAKSRSPDGLDGNGSGTSLTASTRPSSPYPPTKPSGAESSDDSVRSASLAPRPPPCQVSRSRWVRPASP